jgi:hypothetical protein
MKNLEMKSRQMKSHQVKSHKMKSHQMRTRPLLSSLLAVAILLPASTVKAQAAQAQGNRSSVAAAAEGAQLRVRVELSRYRDDRLLTRQPYTFLASEHDARVRMSVKMPVAVSFAGASSENPSIQPVISYKYEDVGTSIDCRTVALADGRYRLTLLIEGTSVYTTSGSTGVSAPDAALLTPEDRPLFRTFSVQLDPVLRAGEKTEAVAATDPATGEVLRVEVGLELAR